MTDGFGTLPPGATVQPCPLAREEKAAYWIEIELVGDDDQPIPWEEYQVRLPDGRETGGYLDGAGHARLEGIACAGDCLVSFPALDRDAWDYIEALPAKPAAI